MRLSPRTVPLGMVLALAAVACGPSGGTTTINISGSSTVEPISALVAGRFDRRGSSGVALTVQGPGTGDGFVAFCAGQTDISDASRPIADTEQQRCADNGVDYVELKIAVDGISVVTSPANDRTGSCLSFADLYALIGPESTGLSTWAAANELAAELGGAHAAPFPDVPLDVFGPGEESGTFDSLVEIALEGIAERRDREATTRPDYNASANDNVIVEGVSGSDTSLGWVGYAFYTESAERVRAFEIVAEDGTCIAPTDETIASGAYPISRPLFIYVNTGRAAAKPALVDFVDFYLRQVGPGARGDTADGAPANAAAASGYVPLTAEEHAATVQTWRSR